MVKEIRLNAHRNTRGHNLVALVDDEDYDLVSNYSWSLMPGKSGARFAQTRIGQAKSQTPRSVLLHRLIMNPSEGMEVDHINGDGLDNRRENLRIVSQSENLRNRRAFRNNKSGLKGVTFNPVNGKWRAVINIGTFNTKEEAAQAFDAAQDKLFGPKNKRNFDN